MAWYCLGMDKGMVRYCRGWKKEWLDIVEGGKWLDIVEGGKRLLNRFIRFLEVEEVLLIIITIIIIIYHYHYYQCRHHHHYINFITTISISPSLPLLSFSISSSSISLPQY